MKTDKRWQQRVVAQLVGWTLFATLMAGYGYSIAQLAGIVS
ncbi:hypothetical protein [Kineobactrum salinum]|nr:hypothetical protein [Kineobactrum salinum]